MPPEPWFRAEGTSRAIRSPVEAAAASPTAAGEEQQVDHEVHDRPGDEVDREPLLPVPAVSGLLLRHRYLLPFRSAGRSRSPMDYRRQHRMVRRAAHPHTSAIDRR